MATVAGPSPQSSALAWGFRPRFVLLAVVVLWSLPATSRADYTLTVAHRTAPSTDTTRFDYDLVHSVTAPPGTCAIPETRKHVQLAHGAQATMDAPANTGHCFGDATGYLARIEVSRPIGWRTADIACTPEPDYVDVEDGQSNDGSTDGRSIVFFHSPPDGAQLNCVIALERVSGGICGDTGGERILATDGDDRLRSRRVTGDVIFGLAGDDRLSGGTGPDCLDGGVGDDDLDGGAGKDLVRGDSGRDLVEGGAQNDEVLGGGGSDTVIGGAGTDRVDGADGDDIVQGNAGNDLLRGGLGSDVLSDGGNANVFEGGDGPDMVFSRQSIAESVDCGGDVDVAVVDRKDTVSGCETVVRGRYWNAKQRPSSSTRLRVTAADSSNDGFYAADHFIRDPNWMVGIAAGHFIGTFELGVPKKCGRELIRRAKAAELKRAAFVLLGQSLGVSAAVLKAKLFASGANLAPLRAYVVKELLPKAIRLGRGAAGLVVGWLAKKGTDAVIGGTSGKCKIARENLDAWLFATKSAVRMKRDRRLLVQWSTTFQQLKPLAVRWDQRMKLIKIGTNYRARDHFHIDFRGICPVC